MIATVIIASFRRLARLAACLGALLAQTRPPDEILVAWQGDDEETREAVERLRARSPSLRAVRSREVGIVPASNAALAVARGDVVLLIDDDAVAPPDWVARHLAHYADPSVGAVGGPAVNHREDGTPFPVRAAGPQGRLSWCGRAIGNMFDHPAEWRARAPVEVDHLVGFNLSLRRAAFDRFEEALRRYWQMFELNACQQVRARGLRVLFDYGIVVAHHPTNRVYAAGREGDLAVKVESAAFNHAFVLAKWSAGPRALARLAYLLAVGSVSAPGLLAWPVAVRRFGAPRRELTVLARSMASHVAGWRAGRRAARDMALRARGAIEPEPACARAIA